MSYNETRRSELKSLLYWSFLLFSISLVTVQPMPFATLMMLSWIIYAMRFEGVGKVIGYLLLAIRRITRFIGIIQGLILHFLEVIHK